MPLAPFTISSVLLAFYLLKLLACCSFWLTVFNRLTNCILLLFFLLVFKLKFMTFVRFLLFLAHGRLIFICNRTFNSLLFMLLLCEMYTCIPERVLQLHRLQNAFLRLSFIQNVLSIQSLIFQIVGTLAMKISGMYYTNFI